MGHNQVKPEYHAVAIEEKVNDKDTVDKDQPELTRVVNYDYKSGQYTGYILDDKPHTTGIWRKATKHLYCGDIRIEIDANWQNGVYKSGLATFTTNDCSVVFKGTFEFSEQPANKLCLTFDDSFFRNLYRNNLTFRSPCIIDGHFINFELHEEASIKYPNEEFHVANSWKNGRLIRATEVYPEKNCTIIGEKFGGNEDGPYTIRNEFGEFHYTFEKGCPVGYVIHTKKSGTSDVYQLLSKKFMIKIHTDIIVEDFKTIDHMLMRPRRKYRLVHETKK